MGAGVAAGPHCHPSLPPKATGLLSQRSGRSRRADGCVLCPFTRPGCPSRKTARQYAFSGSLAATRADAFPRDAGKGFGHRPEWLDLDALALPKGLLPTGRALRAAPIVGIRLIPVPDTARRVPSTCQSSRERSCGVGLQSGSNIRLDRYCSLYGQALGLIVCAKVRVSIRQSCARAVSRSRQFLQNSPQAAILPVDT